MLQAGGNRLSPRCAHTVSDCEFLLPGSGMDFKALRAGEQAKDQADGPLRIEAQARENAGKQNQTKRQRGGRKQRSRKKQ